MKIQRICVIGGTGFVGGHLVARLVKQGYQVRVLARRRETHRELLVLPTAEVVVANVNDQAELNAGLAGCDAVINLVGILNEGRGGRSFENAHVELPRKIIAACQANGIKRLLHMSALNADAANGPSQYLRSKGKGEALVQAASGLQVTSFRPSVIFGLGDSFFNRFAGLLKMLPLAFPLAGAEARFAPVYVGDVVEAFTRALEDKTSFGQSYDLVGPKIYTLKQLVQYTAEQVGVCRVVIGLGSGLSGLMAAVMQFVPGKPLTPDNLRSMSMPSISDQVFPFGILPHSIEAIVPRYLGPRERQEVYQSFRRGAGRDE